MKSTTFIEVARYQVTEDRPIADRLHDIRTSRPGETIWPCSWGFQETWFVSIRFLHEDKPEEKQVIDDMQEARGNGLRPVIYTLGSDARHTLRVAAFDPSELEGMDNAWQIETALRFFLNLPGEDITLVTIDGCGANYYWTYREEQRKRERESAEVWGV